MNDILELEEKINKKSETFWEKITSLFDRIEFLELNSEEKENIAVKVKNDASYDMLYWIEIFLSSVIAALWLLQNSIAVVIGAMLIAPFLRPINGIAFSIARWEKSFFWSSLRLMFFSVIISIIMWYVSVKITWLTRETSEILSRTSPNIIDLFIAIFSAMVAVLSLGFSRLWESVAGVAMAAALMPPLWVIWIEIALWNFNLAWWAMMLFIANLVSMVLVGIIIFWLFWFTPHSWIKQKSSMRGFIFIISVILFISIPLIGSLLSIKQKSIIENKSITYLQSILKQETLDFSISSLEVVSIKNNQIKLLSTIKIPEGLSFYDTFKRQLDQGLSKELWKNVELDIELIRTANIVSIEDRINSEKQQNLQLQEAEKQQQEYINALKTNLEIEIRSELEKEISDYIDEKLSKTLLEKQVFLSGATIK